MMRTPGGFSLTRLVTSDVLNGEPIAPDWLVPDILCKGSMIVLAGDAGVGKSMLCYSLAVALASGRKFLGRQLAADRVLYFDEENSLPDSNAYLRRVWLGMDKPSIASLDANLFLHHMSLTRAYAREMSVIAADVKPALIIIDTANAACQIDDENDNAQASRAIKSLRAARLASTRDDTSVLVLKHAKVTHDKKGNEYRDIRGAKTWKAELDGVIIHTAPRGRPPSHGRYRNTCWWPTKSRAFGLLHPIEVVPVCNGESVRFDWKFPA
jgi:RecA-family ATPase